MWIFLLICSVFDFYHNLIVIGGHILCNYSPITIARIYLMAQYVVSVCNVPRHLERNEDSIYVSSAKDVSCVAQLFHILQMFFSCNNYYKPCIKIFQYIYLRIS